MNTSKHRPFREDMDGQQFQKNLNTNMLDKYKIALKECQIILKAMKAELSSFQDQLKQKNAIIDKLVQEKQGHILHLNKCTGQTSKRELQESNNKNEELKQKINMMVLKYELSMKKNKEELERLKGFNKVLRIQNTHLREDNVLLKNSSNYHRGKRIGMISQSLSKSKELEEPIYSLTVNSKDQTEFNLGKVYYQDNVAVVTPQKLQKSREVSKEMSTESRSNNKYAVNSSLNKKNQYPTAALFQRQNCFSEGNNQSELYINFERSQDKFKTTNLLKIEGWFKKLKDLLDDSDDD